jgi:hypothetical protein
MSNLSRGKYSYMISDRSGQRFPYQEMVQEWNGSWVHISEYEPKQPQLEPKPTTADPQGLRYAHPDRIEPPVIIELTPNPFSTIKYAGNTYINVFSQNHGRSTGNIVRFRGPPQVNTVGTPSREDSFDSVPSFDGVTDISRSQGFTITVGKIDSLGLVSDSLNYFYFQSTDTATTGGVSGGGAQCSAGPVTLQA